MKILNAIILASLCSTTAFAAVSLEQKQEKLKYLELMSAKAQNLNIDSYRRAFNYEKLGLSPKLRAQNEARLMAEQISANLSTQFAQSLKETQDAQASVTELKAVIENDLSLAAPELKDELKEISETTLEQLAKGTQTFEVDTTELEQALLARVQETAKFFNEDSGLNTAAAPAQATDPKLDYESKEELLKVLTSEGPNSPYPGGVAHMSMNSGAITTNDTAISLYVKLEFMGSFIDAGPSVTFSREWSSYVTVLGEGLDPILDSNGYFDFFIKKNGKQVRRLMVFNCNAGMFFQTRTGVFIGGTVGGGTTVLAPVGGYGSARVSNDTAKKYSNSVNLNSRQIFVPGHIGTTPVTLEILNKICHRDFLNARTQKGITVKNSLDIMMKNVVASLRYRHPKTRCVYDTHCVGERKPNTQPRCILDEANGEYAYCENRGLRGQACAAYINGKLASEGPVYRCDSGLSCKIVKQGGWLQEGLLGRLWSPPKAECH